jgi:hypothetical protein
MFDISEQWKLLAGVKSEASKFPKAEKLAERE